MALKYEQFVYRFFRNGEKLKGFTIKIIERRIRNAALGIESNVNISQAKIALVQIGLQREIECLGSGMADIVRSKGFYAQAFERIRKSRNNESLAASCCHSGNFELERSRIRDGHRMFTGFPNRTGPNALVPRNSLVIRGWGNSLLIRIYGAARNQRYGQKRNQSRHNWSAHCQTEK